MIKKLSKKENSRFYDWVRNNKLLERYSKEELIIFYIREIKDLKVQEKIAVTKYYIEHKDSNLLSFTSSFLPITKEYYSQERKKTISKGIKRFLSSMNIRERQEYENSRIDKIKEGRVEKIKNLNSTLSSEELLKLSYLNGIKEKGKKVGSILGLDISLLTNKELISLSGYTKKFNFSKLTDEEKEEKKIIWMKTNLNNKKIRDFLIQFYPEFLEVDLNTKKEVIKWYSAYSSLRSTNFILDNKHSNKKFKHGWFYSSKQNKSFYFRSSYEEKVFKILEENENVTIYQSEPFSFKYLKDNKIRRYVPDVYFIYNDNKILLEIKPKVFVEGFWEEKGKYVIDEIKKKYIFIIITEQQLIKEAFYEHINSNIRNYGKNSVILQTV